MKTPIVTFLFGLAMGLGFLAPAVSFGSVLSKKKSKTSVSNPAAGAVKGTSSMLREAGKYETRLNFRGTKLNGKLQEGSLRKIVVENDKSIEDLLGVRKKFDDRQAEESERNASW